MLFLNFFRVVGAGLWRLELDPADESDGSDESNGSDGLLAKFFVTLVVARMPRWLQRDLSSEIWFRSFRGAGI